MDVFDLLTASSFIPNTLYICYSNVFFLHFIEIRKKIMYVCRNLNNRFKKL